MDPNGGSLLPGEAGANQLPKFLGMIRQPWDVKNM